MKPSPLLDWIVPRPRPEDEAAVAALRAKGFKVRFCTPGRGDGSEAGLRVMQAELFRSADELLTEYASAAMPTLLVAGSAEQEASLLETVRPGDDVVRGLYPSRLLLLRLRRLGGQGQDSDRDSPRDALTGCLRRSEWGEHLVQHLRERPGMDGIGGASGVSAVVLLDLDRFKQVNELYGHAVGDDVLRQVGAELRAGVSAADRLGRYGGDQFALLLTRYDRATLQADIARLQQRIAALEIQAPAATTGPGTGLRHWLSGGTDAGPLCPLELRLASSAGLGFIEAMDGEADFNLLLSRADQAVQSAKRRGRNTLVVFEAPGEAPTPPDAARSEANIDPLTELHNRRYFDARLAREIEAARRHGRTLSLALIDLDHFSAINTGFGMPTGDRALRRFAEVARLSSRLTDWVARSGGSEFCLVMPDTVLSAAVQVAERLRANLAAAELPSLDGRTVRMSASIGVAELSQAPLLQAAGAAVLRAKAEGRNRVAVS